MTSVTLTVFEFDGFLTERARLLVRQPHFRGPDTLNYRVETPPGGGIEIIGRWALAEGDIPPESIRKSGAILQLDVTRRRGT